MRRVIILALLALALPTAALAGSFNFSSGDFVSGTIKGNLRSPFDVELVGSMDTFVLVGATISGSCTPACSFSGGPYQSSLMALRFQYLRTLSPTGQSAP